MDFASPPPTFPWIGLSYPAKHVMLVTINREHAMNSISMEGHWAGDALWNWFDGEPALRVAILTGSGPKAFCAGADLIEQRNRRGPATATTTPAAKSTPDPQLRGMPAGGFFGLSRRLGKKPVIAAVNGYALGGGFEIALNCDLVVASPTATFGLPEAQRGLYAAAGGLPRVVKTFGMQLAGEIAMAGRVLSAKELKDWGFLRMSSTPESLIGEALQLAAAVASQSPDAIIVTRAGLRQAWETASVERAAQLTDERWARGLFGGENIRIGLEAFAKKKRPVWVPSKL